MRVRIVAYNLHNFRDDRASLSGLLRDLAPDVVLLNETGARHRLRRLARELGMAAAADPWSPLRRRVKDAVLVRPPLAVEEHRQRRFAGSVRFYPRGALLARVDGGAVRWWAVAIHLGLRADERLRHVAELLAELADLDDPIIVGGDANERPDGPAMGRLRDRLVDVAHAAAAGTFPSDAPTAKIDHVFVSSDVRVVNAFVPDDARVARASDHRPVVADLEIG
jgi:endonuclease/exonuclease/phosphatase family metal-dependent hydrolase